MSKIIEAAFECLKTPFVHQGRVRNVGMDCAGLVAYVLAKLEIPYIDENGYGRSPFDGQLERAMLGQPSMREIEVSTAVEGDILLMRIQKAPQHLAFHAGFIDGRAYIIHSSEQHGGVVHHSLDGMWSARVMKAYRIECPQ